MIDNLVLVDSSSDIEQLMSKVRNDSKVKVISFDIHAHNKLSKMGIEHEKVENYINKSDRTLIDDLTLQLTKNWYNENAISKFLQYEGINLGWLLELEIISYFLQTLKNFVGVINAVEIEKPTAVFGSTLFATMVKSVDKNNKISIHSIPTKEISILLFDKIIIPINFGKKIVRIHVSRNFAFTMKNIIESIIYRIFSLKFDFKKSTKKDSILLLEFEAGNYDEFLKTLSKLDKNIILLNERRPSIWNFKSFRSITQSRSKTLRLRDFLTEKLLRIIEQKQKDLELHMNEMSLLDENFNILFSIKGYSFWPSIKNDFIAMCKKRFIEAIEKIELTKELFKNMKVTSILTMYNTGLEEKIILSFSNRLGILGIMLQHGFYPQNKYMERFLPLINPYPTLGLKATVWSSQLKEYWVTLGVQNDDILLVGSPKHDPYFHSENKFPSKNTILLASNLIAAIDFAGIDTDVYIRFENMFSDIIKLSNNIPGKKLVVKLHRGQAYYDVVPLIKKIDSSIPIYQSQDIIDFIKECDVLISVTASTVILDAMILDKPTITFLSDPKGFENEEFIKAGASLLVSSPEEFKKALNDILYDEKFRNKLLEKSRKYVKEYMVNPGKSSQILVNFLKGITTNPIS